jgi:hypothetical protein
VPISKRALVDIGIAPLAAGGGRGDKEEDGCMYVPSMLPANGISQQESRLVLSWALLDQTGYTHHITGISVFIYKIPSFNGNPYDHGCTTFPE